MAIKNKIPEETTKKTLKEILEEELKKFDAKLDLFADDPICEQAYDEAQNKENQKINILTKKKTITGAEIIDLLLSRTEPAPLLETIPRWGKYLRECITDWVHNGDLTTKGDGNVDVDFDNCGFRSNDLYYCIREMGILDEMREEKLVVDKRLESRIQESSKPEPTQPELKAVPQSEESQKEPDYSFKSNGAVWDITFHGKALPSVKDTDGMSYIAILIERAIAGRDDYFKHESKIDSAELYAFCKADDKGVNPLVEENFLDNEGRLSGAAKSHPQQGITTTEIIRETEREIKVLNERLKELKTCEDTPENLKKIDECEHEIHEREEYLKRTTRPDPKHPGKRIPVNFTSPSRNASRKIHHALKKSYKNIEQVHPDLANHLQKFISSKDNQFQYCPPEGLISGWTVTLK